MADPAARPGRLDRLHVIVEADPEVGVVPGNDRTWDLAQQKREVLGHLPEAQRLVIDCRVDAERAGIRAAETGDHGNDLDRGRLRERRFHELPAGREARQLERLPGGAHAAANRPVGCAFRQDFVDHGAIGETEDVVEVALGVLGIAARVRATQHRDRPALPKQVAQGVGQLGCLGERADEEDVEITGQLLQESLDAGVAHIVHPMASLLAPDAQDLRHDAGQVCVHQASVNAVAGALCD
jgi:hypothetical protein